MNSKHRWGNTAPNISSPIKVHYRTISDYNYSVFQLEDKINWAFLIGLTIDLLKLGGDAISNPMPDTGPLLQKYADSLEQKHEWKYRTTILILTYLQDNSRPKFETDFINALVVMINIVLNGLPVKYTVNYLIRTS